jgi:hypothetical protein
MRCHHIKDPNLGRACVASELEKGAKSVKVVRRVKVFNVTVGFQSACMACAGVTHACLGVVGVGRDDDSFPGPLAGT